MAGNFPCGIIWSCTDINQSERLLCTCYFINVFLSVFVMSLFVQIKIKCLLNILFSIKSPSRPTLRTLEQPAVLGLPPSDLFTQVKIMRIWWPWSAVYSSGLCGSPENTESPPSERREVTSGIAPFQPEVVERTWEEILNLQKERSLRYWLVRKVKKIKIYEIQYLVFTLANIRRFQKWRNCSNYNHIKLWVHFFYILQLI